MKILVQAYIILKKNELELLIKATPKTELSNVINFAKKNIYISRSKVLNSETILILKEEKTSL